MVIDENCKLGDMKFCKKLQETSWDSKNKEYCCDNSYNDIEVCSFDDFKVKYVKTQGIKSVDALCNTQSNDKIFLIEFKNGKVNTFEVFQKIYDSIIILSKRLDKPIDYFVNNYTFVLVYNQNKLSPNVRCRKYLLGIASNKTNNKNYKIRFGLKKFKGYLCKEVVTISKKEFNTL